MRTLVSLPRKVRPVGRSGFSPGEPVAFMDPDNKRMRSEQDVLFAICHLHEKFPIMKHEFKPEDNFVWVKEENGYIVLAEGLTDRRWPMYKYTLRDGDSRRIIQGRDE